MDRKPLILRFLTLLLMFEPLLKIILLSAQTDFDPIYIAKRGLVLEGIGFFNFWILFPLAGLLLVRLNPYTFIAYFLIQIYTVVFHMNYEAYTWPYLSELPHMSSMILLSFNVVLTLYILLPRTRKLFFNEDLRWWERANRFYVDRPCYIVIEGKEFKGHLDNISFSGALISSSHEISTETEIELDFEILDESFRIPATVARDIYSSKSSKGYGIIFNYPDTWTAFKIKLLLFKVEGLGLLPKYR